MPDGAGNGAAAADNPPNGLACVPLLLGKLKVLAGFLAAEFARKTLVALKSARAAPNGLFEPNVDTEPLDPAAGAVWTPVPMADVATLLELLESVVCDDKILPDDAATLVAAVLLAPIDDVPSLVSTEG